MIRKIHQSAVVMMLAFGLLFVTAATPSAYADGKHRKRSVYQSSYYDNDRNYRDRNDYDYDNDRYRGREDTKRKAITRTAVGAGIGAGVGALVGGKKGALIGAGVGAAGGYLYHKNKVNRNRFPW